MASGIMDKIKDKQAQVVFFSATAIALYGYDQGRLSCYAIICYIRYADVGQA
jgi:hypothetical protein